MAYPASIETLRVAFDGSNGFAISLKNFTKQLRDDSVSGPVERRLFLDLQLSLGEAIVLWNNAKSLPGMQKYARDQFQDQTFNVLVQFTAIGDAAVGVRDWIFSNVPTDISSGAVLEKTVDQNGNVTDLTFTSAQLASFRTEADLFLLTIS